MLAWLHLLPSDVQGTDTMNVLASAVDNLVPFLSWQHVLHEIVPPICKVCNCIFFAVSPRVRTYSNGGYSFIAPFLRSWTIKLVKRSITISQINQPSRYKRLDIILLYRFYVFFKWNRSYTHIQGCFGVSFTLKMKTRWMRVARLVASVPCTSLD